MASKQFNVGMIGYGLSAKVFHIPFVALTPQLSLYAIVQRKATTDNNAPADHPSVKHYNSADDLIADPAVDVVIVGTPPDTHFTIGSAALRAGKHVLVEKPFVPTAAEARELATIAREAGRVLCVYQNRRWDIDFLTVQKLIKDETLGRPVEFDTHFDRFRPEKPAGNWKAELRMDAGGGVLYDLGVHLLDQVYVLFGLPGTVYAKLVSQRDGLVGGEPDSINLTLCYPEQGGLLVHVRAGVLSVESPQPRFWVRGAKGSYRKAGLDPQEYQLREEGMSLSDPAFGHEGKEMAGTLTLAREDGQMKVSTLPSVEPVTYLEFYRQFAKSLETGKEEDIPVPASQAADVLRIIEAARQSAETGREVKL